MSKYIDLHLHLDGAITVTIARKLADMQGIELPPKDKELERLLTVREDCASLNDFLKCFELPLSLLQTKEALCEAVYLVAEELKAQKVIYAEIRFAPQLHTEKGMTQELAILAALDGLKRTKLKANLILCCMRGNGNELQNKETVELANKYLVKDGGVTAIDLAGAEALYPTSDYESLFKLAAELGIPFTIHAGEADGAGSVMKAISYGAKRIGHGVRIFEDKEAVRMVREKGIFLEMCPSSNRLTYAVDMSEYPLKDYLEEGIRVTLNTDDPAIEGTTIENEFEIMRSLGLTPKQENTLQLNAAMAAFTDDKTRQWLISEMSNSNNSIILKKLIEKQDLDYRAFQAKLTPTLTIEDFIGVRTPDLRAIAKELYKVKEDEVRAEIDSFLLDLPHRYFDENQIHSFYIGLMKDYDECIQKVNEFLPYIDNWATCDQLSPKCFKKHRAELKEEILNWLKSDKTYTIRFGIEMIMSHFLDEDFDEGLMVEVAKIRSDEYYVNMMIAWYFATALAKQWDSAIGYIENNRLSAWTHNKTIQKSIESYRITNEQKEYLRSLKVTVAESLKK